MKKYTNPELELIQFRTGDAIGTSIPSVKSFDSNEVTLDEVGGKSRTQEYTGLFWNK